MKPDDPIAHILPRAKRAQLRGFARLGIHTVRDLLYHFPRRYTSTDSFDGTLESDTYVALSGTVESIRMRKTRGKKRIMITEATVRSAGKKVRAVWFHQPYIANKFVADDVVEISGKTTGTAKPYLANPVIRKTDGGGEDAENKEGKEFIPVYPETAGISSLFIAGTVRNILADDGIKRTEDPLPETTRSKFNLPALYDALVWIHLPRDKKHHAAARKRFIFEQTFRMRTKQELSRDERTESKTYELTVSARATGDFMRERFEFTPTEDQKKAVKDILADIGKNRPMTRLLEGDVGSGKTAVAAAVIHGIISATPAEKTSGRPQVAYLAPTEVLAGQQFNTLVKLFAHLPVSIGLMAGTGCRKYPSKTNPDRATDVSKTQMKKWIATGEIAVIVGTHAVIQKDIDFRRLALVIIDEQHRFGVAQRRKLIGNTDTHTPHLLSMTATPIPRTLALTIYGDLDITVMEKMPEGRKPVKTALVRAEEISGVYDHIRKETEKGRQAYILCPRVHEDDESHLRSVEEEYTHITTHIFPDLRIAALHGKMKPKEKREVMAKFTGGLTDVLVCTTVVEVGVNVPNATVIAILHAERFGLAQLHQIRGRVIRSTHQPYCYAVTKSTAEPTLERLKTFEKNHNGFVLAQKDLDMRGGGELAGLRQSGVPDLVLEGLRNPKLLACAGQEAIRIVRTDPTLASHTALRTYLSEDNTHTE